MPFIPADLYNKKRFSMRLSIILESFFYLNNLFETRLLYINVDINIYT
jgi:hypothetical protein